MAGAVIGVHGLAGRSSESAVTAYAERVAVESCTLLRSGKFMWDYGYLWQIMTWPESYEPWEVERAKKYFRMDQVHEVTMQHEDDRVRVNNSVKPIAVSQTDDPKEALTFLGALEHDATKAAGRLFLFARPKAVTLNEGHVLPAASAVIARSVATKQSRISSQRHIWIASLRSQ
jgi:hypothetical protein